MKTTYEYYDNGQVFATREEFNGGSEFVGFHDLDIHSIPDKNVLRDEFGVYVSYEEDGMPGFKSESEVAVEGAIDQAKKILRMNGFLIFDPVTEQEIVSAYAARYPDRIKPRQIKNIQRNYSNPECSIDMKDSIIAGLIYKHSAKRFYSKKPYLDLSTK